MEERTLKMKNGTVIKDIPENLVSQYLQMGWTEVKEKKEFLDDEIGKKFLKGNK